MTEKYIDTSHLETGNASSDTAPDPEDRSTVQGDHGPDILSDEFSNPMIRKKISLVNDAIDEIGWTPFHTKLFCVGGFGYAADSLVAMLAGITAVQAYAELGDGGYPTGLTIAIYTGLLFGALFWGWMADLIGRGLAFNSTLFFVSISTIVAGAAPNWPVLGLFVALAGFGAGGNLVLDPTVFLEFLPSKYQFAVTAMAGWWGVGISSSGFIAWGCYSRSDWSCDATSPESCTWDNNKGWRMIFFIAGALCLTGSLIRISTVRLQETPKYLISSGQDRKLATLLQELAAKYNRPCSLTYEDLVACGTAPEVEVKHSGVLKTIAAIKGHFEGLFGTRKLALSMTLVWLSWLCMGLAYPLFFLFLPTIIASRIPDYHQTFNETWRDFTITSVCAIFGPILASGICEIKLLGRRYTLTVTAILTAVFFFSYIQISTPTQNIALSATISVCINAYYGTLYAYSAEVFPSAHRTTGSGTAVALNRVMGIMSAIIAQEGGTGTVVPLYVCAGVFLLMAVISVFLPFEPRGSRSS